MMGRTRWRTPVGPGKRLRRATAVAGLLTCASAFGCGDVDTRPATWSYLSPAIFQPNCATSSCHGPAAAVSGLDFSTPQRGYTSLTDLWVWVVVAPDAGVPPAGVPCATVEGTLVCEEQLRPLVTPFDPANSRVVNMLRARDAPRMPPDRPLTEPDIRLVERWISNGACASGLSCNGGGGGGAGDGGLGN
jgi:hypothetical protein